MALPTTRTTAKKLLTPRRRQHGHHTPAQHHDRVPTRQRSYRAATPGLCLLPENLYSKYTAPMHYNDSVFHTHTTNTHTPTSHGHAGSQRTIRRRRLRKQAKARTRSVELEELVVNEAGITIDTHLHNALTKGLSFIPTTGPVPENQVRNSLESFRRHINLRLHWETRGSDGPRRSLLGGAIPSLWQPPDVVKWSEPWDTCLRLLRGPPNIQRNMPEAELTAWKNLRDDSSVYITKADKGGRIVLWNSQNYVTEATRQLADPLTYQELSQEEATARLAALLDDRNQLLHELARGGFITTTERDRAIALTGGTPAIYFLPKVHKPKREDTGTFPGRPIIAAINGPLKPLDVYLAKLTAPLLPTIPGSLVDTKQLINQLETLATLPGDACLFSADVESLYPSIPWVEGIAAATRYYASHFHLTSQRATTDGTLPPPNPKLFRKLISLIIQRNIFHFQNRRWFLQRSGTAMGCSISVYFANTFMYYRTRTLLTQPPHDLLYLGRYIDDIVGIWSGPRDAIPDLFKETTDENIRLTFVIGGRHLEALDLNIHIEDPGTIRLTLFRKPTDGHQFVHYGSDHPEHIKRSLPYSQLLRLKRNNTTQTDYERDAATLIDRFRQRGYPRNLLLEALRKAERHPRTDLLHPPRERPRKNPVTIVIPYRGATRDLAPTTIADLYKTTLNSAQVQERLPYMRVRLPPDPPLLAYQVGRRLGHGLGKLLKEGKTDLPNPPISVTTANNTALSNPPRTLPITSNTGRT